MGYIVIRLVRAPHDPSIPQIRWDPEKKEIDSSLLHDIDAVVHLSGENIGDGRWTEDKKARIFESRVISTSFLSQTIANLSSRPRVLVCASATGYYGNRGEQILDESARIGSGFLPDLVREWEASTWPASNSGVRVVNTRFGVVLGADGGMLKRLLPLFKTGLGGKLGSGHQYMSWIALDDVLAAIIRAINTDSLSGPVNFTSPNPVTNAEFTKTLADLVDRNEFFAAPSWALRLVFGEMADETLLSSTRAVPKKLLDSGYRFKYEKISDALRSMLV
jgi:hypothetical protein